MLVAEGGVTVAKTTSYAYDMARRSVTLTLPDGATRTKTLDTRGRLDSVYLDGMMVAYFSYNNNVHAGTKLGNGIEASYGRDVAGRLTSLAYGENGQPPVLRHDLGWDFAGQLTWTKKVPDAIADERYGMDKQGQLTEWKTGMLDATNGIAAPADSLGWNLDARGNWTNVYDSKATVDTRTHSGANAVNVRNGVALSYDGAGNLLNDGVNAYEWTLDGLLAKVSTGLDTVTLQYDGQRRLVSRTAKIAGVSTLDAYVWDGWQLAQEYRSGTANTYAYGSYIDDRIAMKNGSGTYYFHRSYNQTAEAVTDASGSLVERYIATNPYGGYVMQDASGNALATSVIGNRSVFQGAPMTEPVSGLVYLRNRWYSPTLGRFVSRDPAKDGLNWYAFGTNQPQQQGDPLGLAWNSFDFTWHYFYGRGMPVDLGNVGLLDEFKGWASSASGVRSQVATDVYNGKMSGQASGTFSAKGIAWTLGGVDVKAAFSCSSCKCAKSSTCNIDYWINEFYSDPANAWEWFFSGVQPGKENDRNWYYNPGTPYQITANWKEKIIVPCPLKEQ